MADNLEGSHSVNMSRSARRYWPINLRQSQNTAAVTITHSANAVGCANPLSLCIVPLACFHCSSCMAHDEPKTLLLIALGIVLVLITIFMIRTSTR